MMMMLCMLSKPFKNATLSCSLTVKSCKGGSFNSSFFSLAASSFMKNSILGTSSSFFHSFMGEAHLHL